MVQYIFTPWRDRQELLLSTALLFAAVLSDEIAATQSAGSSAYAVRAAYSAAFSRFVTGLLDGHQDKLRKQSMYSIAKVIGLPATFVELRHQATHEQLPSLAKLRPAAHRALDWIWDYYWKQLDQGGDVAESAQDPCKAAVLRYLREEDSQRRQAILGRELSKWTMDELMATIKDLQTTLPGNQAFLKCMKLKQELIGLEKAKLEAPVVPQEPQPTVLEAPVVEEEEPHEDDIGWSKYQGQWKPKPIGIIAVSRAMHIQSIPMWVGTSNNYAYLVVDDKSKDAVIIDPANPPEYVLPVRVAPVLKDATASGKINLTSIVNTHHHWDHAGGNKKLVRCPIRVSMEMKDLTHARQLEDLGNPKLKIIGGKNCEGVTQTPKHEEVFKVGDISVKAVHTPCHTQDSICYYMEDSTGKAVFTGDTLFISGCGRFFEGNAAEMHEALNKRLAALPEDTVVYPGHEYTKANVQFAISVLQSEPVKALQDFAENNKVTTGKFTIGDEKKHNVFMRLDDPVVQKATGATEPVEVMAQLREMKNSFNLFAEPMDGEKNGVLPTDDVKSALMCVLSLFSPNSLPTYFSIC
ncbi:hypothetical protein LLEC1_03262 [Akanthomyces lecanii]|uniref:hydroxyacylglutathione hydrolase n=1 Tax=Cordyceps confragosa TaxID=2714763 RepID=A0A179I071_CORDF|nr:hypothetical protein LLEC1_03262 [Akanthomyces lecanii]